MLETSELLTAYEDATPAVLAADSGFPTLDGVTGGMVAGRVWVITGAPGHGRTTLTVQLACRLASASDQWVHLVTPSDDPQRVAAWLMAVQGASFDSQAKRCVPDGDRARYEEARQRVSDLALAVYASGEDTYVPEVHPFKARGGVPTAVVVDDADRVSGMGPFAVEACRDAGQFVLVSLPRHLLFGDTGNGSNLDPGWARAADVILELSTPGVPEAKSRPGEVDLRILYNRWGFSRSVLLHHQPQWARFREAHS
ncbi:DnaB-like helicase C-terminal domain-containing protein [Nocardioides daphniae]|nr:DnaB-like helicase C-terminal domain-containing protein [Nocardioides daphniae]GGD24524.1 hypothetical protein GCM10007231_24640 [Nocardioides daphniae]